MLLYSTLWSMGNRTDMQTKGRKYIKWTEYGQQYIKRVWATGQCVNERQVCELYKNDR